MKKILKIKKKTGLKKKGRVSICQEKKKLPLWKRLVLAELHAGVQILNKEVVVKPKFTIRNVKNEVSFSLCKYHPWCKNICIQNTCLESQFWKLYVDSLSCSSAQFEVFPFLSRFFSLPLATLPINFSSSLTLHLAIEIQKRVCNGFLFPGNLGT